MAFKEGSHRGSFARGFIQAFLQAQRLQMQRQFFEARAEQIKLEERLKGYDPDTGKFWNPTGGPDGKGAYDSNHWMGPPWQPTNPANAGDAAVVAGAGRSPGAGQTGNIYQQGDPAVRDHIIQWANDHGKDPEEALKMWRQESASGTKMVGDGGSSFSDFQFHFGGMNNSTPALAANGMGDDFLRDTGIDVRQPLTQEQRFKAIDYALERANKVGWRPDWKTSADTLGFGSKWADAPSKATTTTTATTETAPAKTVTPPVTNQPSTVKFNKWGGTTSTDKNGNVINTDKDGNRVDEKGNPITAQAGFQPYEVAGPAMAISPQAAARQRADLAAHRATAIPPGPTLGDSVSGRTPYAAPYDPNNQRRTSADLRQPAYSPSNVWPIPADSPSLRVPPSRTIYQNVAEGAVPRAPLAQATEGDAERQAAEAAMAPRIASAQAERFPVTTLSGRPGDFQGPPNTGYLMPPKAGPAGQTPTVGPTVRPQFGPENTGYLIPPQAGPTGQAPTVGPRVLPPTGGNPNAPQGGPLPSGPESLPIQPFAPPEHPSTMRYPSWSTPGGPAAPIQTAPAQIMTGRRPEMLTSTVGPKDPRLQPAPTAAPARAIPAAAGMDPRFVTIDRPNMDPTMRGSPRASIPQTTALDLSKLFNRGPAPTQTTPTPVQTTPPVTPQSVASSIASPVMSAAQSLIGQNAARNRADIQNAPKPVADTTAPQPAPAQTSQAIPPGPGMDFASSNKNQDFDDMMAMQSMDQDWNTGMNDMSAVYGASRKGGPVQRYARGGMVAPRMRFQTGAAVTTGPGVRTATASNTIDPLTSSSWYSGVTPTRQELLNERNALFSNDPNYATGNWSAQDMSNWVSAMTPDQQAWLTQANKAIDSNTSIAGYTQNEGRGYSSSNPSVPTTSLTANGWNTQVAPILQNEVYNQAGVSPAAMAANTPAAVTPTPTPASTSPAATPLPAQPVVTTTDTANPNNVINYTTPPNTTAQGNAFTGNPVNYPQGTNYFGPNYNSAAFNQTNLPGAATPTTNLLDDGGGVSASPFGMPPGLGGQGQQIPPVYFNPQVYAAAGAPINRGPSQSTIPTFAGMAVPTYAARKGGAIPPRPFVKPLPRVKRYAGGGGVDDSMEDPEGEAMTSEMMFQDQMSGGGRGMDEPMPAPQQEAPLQLPSEEVWTPDAQPSPQAQDVSFHMHVPSGGGDFRIPGGGGMSGPRMSVGAGPRLSTAIPRAPRGTGEDIFPPGAENLDYDTPPAASQASSEPPVNQNGDLSQGMLGLIKAGFDFITGQTKPGSQLPPDQNTADARREMVTGEGGADPKDVEELHQHIGQHLDQSQSMDKGMQNIYSMYLVANHHLLNGDVAGAQRFMASMLIYSQEMAAKYGQEAVKRFYNGDVQGALNNLSEAYQYAPDAQRIQGTANPDGSANVQLTNSQGILKWQGTVAPQEILVAAVGAQDKSMFWNIVQNQAAQAGEPGARMAINQEEQERQEDIALQANKGVQHGGWTQPTPGSEAAPTSPQSTPVSAPTGPGPAGPPSTSAVAPAGNASQPPIKPDTGVDTGPKQAIPGPTNVALRNRGAEAAIAQQQNPLDPGVLQQANLKAEQTLHGQFFDQRTGYFKREDGALLQPPIKPADYGGSTPIAKERTKNYDNDLKNYNTEYARMETDYKQQLAAVKGDIAANARSAVQANAIAAASKRQLAGQVFSATKTQETEQAKAKAAAQAALTAEKAKASAPHTVEEANRMFSRVPDATTNALTGKDPDEYYYQALGQILEGHKIDPVAGKNVYDKNFSLNQQATLRDALVSGWTWSGNLSPLSIADALSGYTSGAYFASKIDKVEPDGYTSTYGDRYQVTFERPSDHSQVRVTLPENDWANVKGMRNNIQGMQEGNKKSEGVHGGREAPAPTPAPTPTAIPRQPSRPTLPTQGFGPPTPLRGGPGPTESWGDWLTRQGLISEDQPAQ